ncbi:hypothetical protein AK812_SmicGene31647 [Symbiodinium microadriaticum]|uniref:Uncharacterized protein n=1 Tax=Symbiodinium microadriaticum TaxID=2951 RepID=A0A1Q9CW30_SYMMI|nr:hypothetical protein AK812_SmicGene31647 [Symbiodinium microadriaticum]
MVLLSRRCAAVREASLQRDVRYVGHWINHISNRAWIASLRNAHEGADEAIVSQPQTEYHEASLGTIRPSMGPSDITPLHREVFVLDSRRNLFVTSTSIFISVALAIVTIAGCLSGAVSAVKPLTLRTSAWCPSLRRVHEGRDDTTCLAMWGVNKWRKWKWLCRVVRQCVPQSPSRVSAFAVRFFLFAVQSFAAADPPS